MPGVFQFSQTAANNATAVPTISWAEGQAPSSINDSSRAEMAAVACYRDDLSGMLVTTGTGQNYQIAATNQGFDTLTNFNNKTIAFTPHLTQTGSPVTLSVDGFANVPLRSSPGVELPPGTLIKGTPYAAIYNQADNALYLQGFYGQPNSVPIGGTIIWWTPTLPNSNSTWCNGAAISRTTYATLFAMFGTGFGSGDGSTTFNLPDMREVTPIGVAGMGGTAGRGLTSFPGYNVLNTVFGLQSETIAQSQLPNVGLAVGGSASGSISGLAAMNQVAINAGSSLLAYTPAGGSFSPAAVSGTFSGSISGGTSSLNGGVGQAPLNVMQPSITCGYIIRVL
jgi:microcystin-dependent protein